MFNILLKNKKISALFFFFVFAFVVSFFAPSVFASWSGFLYSPGDTLNPECLPTDTNCDVTAPLTSANIDNTAYGVSWNSDTTHAPTKNAVYSKIQSLYSGSALLDQSTSQTIGTTGARLNKLWADNITLTNAPKIDSLHAGSIVFVDSNNQLTEDNTNLAWDNINKQLQVGTPPTSFAGNPLFSLSVANNVDSYSGMYTQNVNGGVSASSDYMVGADNDGVGLLGHYGDFGVINSGWDAISNPLMNGMSANDVYMYGSGGNLILGTDAGVAGKVVKFFVGGFTAADQMATLDRTGFGIGTNTPGAALDVKGNIRISGSSSGYVGFAVPSSAGTTTYTLPNTDGSNNYVLTTDGSGNLSWSNKTGGTPGTINSLNGDSSSAQTLSAGAGLNVSNSGATHSYSLNTTYAPTWSGIHVFSNSTNSALFTGGNVGIGTVAPAGLLSVTPLQYNTGTASQNNSTTVVGVGTNFTSAMIGSQFVYANGVSTGPVTAVTDPTHLTVVTSQTVASQGYKISYSGLQVATNGNVGVGTENPASLFSVGYQSPFQVDSTGAIVSSSSINSSGIISATLPSGSFGTIASFGANGAGGLVNIGYEDGSGISSITGSGFGPFQVASSGNNNIIINPGSGNVGIGSTTPSALLSVGSSNSFQVNDSGDVIAHDVTLNTVNGSALGSNAFTSTAYYPNANPSNYIPLTALSSTATGLTYTNTTGVFSLTSGYAIPTTSSQTNWNTAYTNRITSLTTTGSSGAATLSANTLNIPNYTLSGLLPALTSGSVLFSNGTTVAQDNSNFFYDSTNHRLGLGTTTPGRRLYVKDSNTPLTLENTAASGQAVLDLYSPNVPESTVLGANINWASDNTSATRLQFASIATFYRSKTAGAESADLVFNTINAGVGGSPAERMRIQSNGNVGIGTSSPTQKLDVVGTIRSTAETAALNNISAGVMAQRTTDDSVLYFGFRTIPDAWVIGASYGTTGAYKPVLFATSDTERMRITSAGNVGIGTTTPAGKLTVGVAPTASANYGTLSLGGGAFDGTTAGFFGTSSSSNALGTSIAVNEATGYSGDLMNVQVGGVSKFKVQNDGTARFAATGIFSGNISASGFLNVGVAPSRLASPSDGVWTFSNNAATDVGRVQFGGTSNSFNAIARDAVNGFSIQSAAGTATYNDASTAAAGTVANRYIFGMAAPTLTATNTTVTDTIASTLYIGGAPTASTNTTIGTAYALNVAAGSSHFGGNLLLDNAQSLQWKSVAGVSNSILTVSSGDNVTLSSITSSGSNDVYLNSSSTFALKGNGQVGVGIASPSSKFHVVASSGSQLRLGYDTTNYMNFTVGSANSLTLVPGVASTTGFNITKTDGSTSVFDVDTVNSRVGIGTTTPGALLDVFGTGQIMMMGNGTSADAYIDFAGNRSKFGFEAATGIRFQGTSTRPIVFAQGVWGAGELARFAAITGNFGLGTTSPTANFQVSQSATGFGTVAVSGTAVTGTNTQFTNTFKVGDTITVTTTSGSETKTITAVTSDTVLATAAFAGTASAGTAYTLTGGTRFSVFGNGNVGIGTTTPTSTLHVAGSSLITGQANFGNTANWIDVVSTVMRARTDAGGFAVVPNGGEVARFTGTGLGIGTTATTANLQVAQGTAGIGTVTTTATGTTVTGTNTQFLNTFKIGDTITVNGETRTISAIASNTSLTTDAWTGANTGLAYTLVGGTRFSVFGNGNVGIANTSPLEALDVGGSINFSSALFRTGLGGKRNVLYTSGNNEIFDLHDNAGTTLVQLKTSGNSYFNGGGLGIGTNAPVSRLHVGVAPTASANYGLVSLGNGAFDGTTAGFFGTSSSSSANGTYIAANAVTGYTGDFLNYEINGSSQLRITSSGNIGIGMGVSSPSQPLDITTSSPKIRLNNSSTSQPSAILFAASGSIKATFGTSTATNQVITGSAANDVVLSSVNNILFSAGNVTSASHFSINTSGFVGIGTNSASTLFEMGSFDLGAGLAGPVFTLGRNTNATNTGAGSINFQSKAGTAGYVWQDAAGNIRINTASPSNANDTAGTVVGAQTSTRDTKQDIADYTDYSASLQMVLDAPLHTFRYIREVNGYGSDSPLAKTRIGYIADEVNPAFMVGNVIDQVSVNGILMASVKEENSKIVAMDLRVKALENSNLGSHGVSNLMSDFFGTVVTQVSGTMASIRDLTVETLHVGSPTKRTGITIYDEVTGDPFCIKVVSGAMQTVPGECGVVNAPAPAVVSPEPVAPLVVGENPAPAGEVIVDPAPAQTPSSEITPQQ